MPKLVSLDSIIIDRVIIHRLDANETEAGLSDYPAALDEDSEEYLSAHILKAFNSDDAKKCTFAGNSYFAASMPAIGEKFIDVSRELAKRFFDCMREAGSIPSGDLMVMLAEIGCEEWFCALKFNYKSSYIHEFRSVANTNAMNFVKHDGVLPGKNAGVGEALFINTDTLEINLLEKKYEIGGVKDYYISNSILGVTDKVSIKTQLKTVEKIGERIYKEHYGATVDMKPRVAQVMCRELSSQSTFRMDNIITGFTDEFPEAGGDFHSVVDALPLETGTLLPVPETLVRRISKQTIKTKDGIEIKIPVRIYNDGRAMEYVRENDGSLTLIIKNIDEGKENGENE